jgi:hypothetical protein
LNFREEAKSNNINKKLEGVGKLIFIGFAMYGG